MRCNDCFSRYYNPNLRRRLLRNLQSLTQHQFKFTWWTWWAIECISCESSFWNAALTCISVDPLDRAKSISWCFVISPSVGDLEMVQRFHEGFPLLLFSWQRQSTTCVAANSWSNPWKTYGAFSLVFTSRYVSIRSTPKPWWKKNPIRNELSWRNEWSYHGLPRMKVHRENRFFSTRFVYEIHYPAGGSGILHMRLDYSNN